MINDDNGPGPLPWEAEEFYELTDRTIHPEKGAYLRVQWKIFNIPKDAFKEMMTEAVQNKWVEKEWYVLLRDKKPPQLWINEQIKAGFESLMRLLAEKYSIKADSSHEDIEKFLGGKS